MTAETGKLNGEQSWHLTSEVGFRNPPLSLSLEELMQSYVDGRQPIIRFSQQQDILVSAILLILERQCTVCVQSVPSLT